MFLLKGNCKKRYTLCSDTYSGAKYTMKEMMLPTNQKVDVLNSWLFAEIKRG